MNCAFDAYLSAIHLLFFSIVQFVLHGKDEKLTKDSTKNDMSRKPPSIGKKYALDIAAFYLRVWLYLWQKSSPLNIDK